jgi:hypothetical protein
MTRRTFSCAELREVAGRLATPSDIRERCLTFLEGQADSFSASGDEVSRSELLQIYENRVSPPVEPTQLPVGTLQLVAELRRYQSEQVYVLASEAGPYAGFFVAPDESRMIGFIVSD